MAYQIRLVNYLFDNSYENTVRFDDAAAQKAFFELLPGTKYSAAINFTCKDLDNTTVDVKLSDDYESLKKLLGFNYALVKHSKTNELLFFFVRNAEQLIGGNVRVFLENDVIQNHHIEAEYSDCMILRAHLNRFVEAGEPGKIKFDGSTNSKLFAREELRNVSKRLIKRTKIEQRVLLSRRLENRLDVTEWLKKNVVMWMYIYVDSNRDWATTLQTPPPTRKLAAIKYQGGKYVDDPSQRNFYYEGSAAVLAMPIYRGAFRMRATSSTADGGVAANTYAEISTSAMSMLLSANKAYSFIYKIKYSHRPPAIIQNSVQIGGVSGQGADDLLMSMYVDDFITFGQQRMIVCRVDDFTAKHPNLEDDYPSASGMGLQYSMETEEYVTGCEYEFAKVDLIKDDRDPKYNPKLLSEDYREINIVNTSGESFTYDAQKINKKKLVFIHHEPLVADLTRAYTRLKIDDDGIFIKATERNYTGLVAAFDNSISVENDAYSQMLATQANYVLQKDLGYKKQRDDALLNAGIGATAGGIMKGWIGAGAGLAGGAINMIKTERNIAYDKAQAKLTLDNVRKSPSSMVNTSGATILNAAVNEVGLFVEEYDILDSEKKIINDEMYKNGFTYNQIDNIKSCDNIRRNFNYVQAVIDHIKINASNNVINRLKQIFAAGVRFWNDTAELGKYMKNNERWIEK